MEQRKTIIRVLVNDNYQIYREGIIRIIRSEKIFELAAVSQDNELLNLVKTTLPDVVLTAVDSKQAGIDGLVRSIVQQHPNTSVLALSTFEHDQEIVQALRAGAHGCLLRTANRAEVIQAIHMAKKFTYYYSPQIVGRLAALIGRRDAPKYMLQPIPYLSEKDKAFIKFLCTGYSMKEIAAATGISVHTLESKKRKIYSRLNTPNIATLLNYAILNGLYNPFVK
jgi:two-component system, NarL family, response regulator NreC